jgi:hormone-sensitive lipase
LPEDICEYNLEAIKVRLLYNDTIHVVNKKPSLNFFCCGSPNFIPKDITSIIIHFHGGGFVALSSRSMQTYTRKWARELKTPVFSIDYRKPPYHRFPTAPYDCLTVYSFLVNHIHKYFNINP